MSAFNIPATAAAVIAGLGLGAVGLWQRLQEQLAPSLTLAPGAWRAEVHDLITRLRPAGEEITVRVDQFNAVHYALAPTITSVQTVLRDRITAPLATTLSGGNGDGVARLHGDTLSLDERAGLERLDRALSSGEVNWLREEVMPCSAGWRGRLVRWATDDGDETDCQGSARVGQECVSLFAIRTATNPYGAQRPLVLVRFGDGVELFVWDGDVEFESHSATEVVAGIADDRERGA